MAENIRIPGPRILPKYIIGVYTPSNVSRVSKSVKIVLLEWVQIIWTDFLVVHEAHNTGT